MMRRIFFPILLIQSELFAASATWTSTSSSSMVVPGNWSPSGTPADGTFLSFPPGPTGIQFTVINDIGPFTLGTVSGSDPTSLSITNNGSTAYMISPSVAANVFKAPSGGVAQITFGSSTGSLASTLAVPLSLNSGTIDLIGSAAFDRITGGVTGTGTLQVKGGMLQISGSNTYTGPTNIIAGTLRLGSGSSLPTATTLTLSSGGIFDLNNQNQTFSSTVTVNTGGIIKTGTGTITVSNLAGSGNVTINSGGTVRVNNTGTNTFAGQLVTGASGAGGTFELGATSTGTFTLSGANAYSTQTTIGYTTVSGGTLKAGNASAFGTKSNLSIASGATLDLDGNTSIFNTLSGAGTLSIGSGNATVTVSAGSNQTFSGVISGTGTTQFIYAGTDKLTLSGTMNSVPTVAITGGGTLNVSSLTNINTVLFETATNGTLQFGAAITGSSAMTLSAANANIDTNGNAVTLNGNISAGGSLTKKGAGTLTLGGGGNNYSGGTIVSQGTVAISSSTAFPTERNLSIASGAVFDMQQNSITIGTLSGAGTLSMGMMMGDATVSVGGTTFSGAITGGGNFIYAGNATLLTLSGANTYTGTTSITGLGTLNVTQSAFNTTTGLIFSSSGGTLQAGGVLTTPSTIPITLSANGVIDTNGHDSTMSGNITGASGFSFTKTGSGILTLDGSASTYQGQTNVFGGTLRAGSASAFGATSALNIKSNAVADLNGNTISLVQLLGDVDSSLMLGSGMLTITGGISTNPFYGVISGTGDVVLDGGSPTFMGENTYSGTTTIQDNAEFNTVTLDSVTGDIIFGTGGGTLTIGSNTTSSSAYSLNNAATIATNTFDLTITGVITGTANTFTKLGSGTLYLNPGSANDFTSTPISIQGGTLRTTSDGFGTPDSITFQNFCGTLKFEEAMTITSPITVSSVATIDTNGHNVTISSDITKPAAATGLPSGGLQKTGLGTLTLSGTMNDYTQPTTISGGTLLASNTSLPLPTMSFVNTMIFSGDGSGIFQASSAFSTFPVIILNQSGTIDTNGNNMTLDNIVAGVSSSSFIKTGMGTLTLTAANLYTGPTVIEQGTLIVSTTSLPSSSTVQFTGMNNGVLQPSEAMPAIGNAFSVQGDGTINAAFDMTITGIISGTSGNTFSKEGTGTLVLSGANTYSCATAVNAGILRAGVATGSSGAFGENSAITVANGATLDFSMYANSVASITNSGTVSSGETITTGTYTQDSMGTTSFDFLTNNATPVGNVVATGLITLDGDLTVSTSGFSGGQNVTLFQSSGSGKQINGAFATTTLPFGTIRYDYSENKVILVSGGSTSCDASWSQAGDGDWNSSMNWMSCVPGVMGNTDDAATFPTVGAAAVTVTLANSSGTASQDVTLQFIDFDSSSTDYTIAQYMSGGTITLDSMTTQTPIIHVILGDHTINAPITLNKDSRFMISTGSLTLGPAVTISSTAGQWNLSEGSGSGTLNNQGMILPSSLLIEGNTVMNSGTIHPTGALSISGLGGTSGAIVTNSGTLISGTTFTLGNSAGDSTLTNTMNASSTGAFMVGGGSGATQLTNSGTLVSGTTLSFGGGTGTTTLDNTGTVTAGSTLSVGLNSVINNNSGGLISSTGALTVSGGTVTNEDGATFGSLTADFTYNGGSLMSKGNLRANNYVQGSSVTLNLEFPNATAAVGHINAMGIITMNGDLSVSAMNGYTGGQNVTLLRALGVGQKLKGKFNNIAVSPTSLGRVRVDHSENKVILSSGSSSCQASWDVAGDGNWNVMGNWASCIPGISGNNDDDADFPNYPGTASIAIELSDGMTAVDVVLQFLDFDAVDTSYTINQLGSLGTITIDSTQTDTPILHVIAGDHTIDAPIILGKEARFQISSGSLTLGTNATVTSVAGKWNLSEGNGSGTLNNHGSITTTELLIEGNTVNNYQTISPTDALSISGLDGINNTAIVNNFATLTSGKTFEIGAAGGPSTLNNTGTVTSAQAFTIGSGEGVTTVTNSGTITSMSTLMIQSGSITNSLGGVISTSGSAITVSGGSITNASGATFGSSGVDLTLSGGTLATSGNVLANNYTQSGSATLQTNVSSLTAFGKVTADGVGAVGGNLVVYANPGISLVDGDTVNLVTAVGGINQQFSSTSFENFPASLIPSIVYLENAVQLDVRATHPSPTQGVTIATVFNAIGQHNSFLTLQMMHMRDRMTQPTPEQVASRFLPYSIDELLASNKLIAQQPGILQKSAQLGKRIEEEAFPWSIYSGPVATFGHVKSKGDQLGMGYASAGALIGFDRLIQDEEHRSYRTGVGAIFEYRKIWGDVLNNGGSNSVDRVHGSVYATAIPKSVPNLAIEGVAGFAFNWDELTRTTGINQGSTAHGNTTETIGDVLFGLEYSLSGREYRHMPEEFTFIPLMIWQYIIDYVASYNETGAGIYNLHIDSYTAQSLTSLLGARFQYLFRGNRADLRLEIDAGWQFEYLDRSLVIGANAFNVTSQTITSTTIPPGRNSLQLALDLLSLIDGGWTVEANCTYLLNSLFYDVYFYLGFGREF